ncbi:MAG: XRE family transcriptional regulator [Caulobacteraceae bacterium]|jgi:transcriptional regulator with XRE-family HTH domain|nr:XRE family transcriptional regulator [Caulobacteraceae bacterium]
MNERKLNPQPYNIADMRTIRGRAGMSLTATARASGTSQSSISNFELDQRYCGYTAGFVERVCEAIGATAEETAASTFRAKKLPTDVHDAVFGDWETYRAVVAMVRKRGR